MLTGRPVHRKTVILQGAIIICPKGLAYYLVVALLLSDLLGPLRTAEHPRGWLTIYQDLHHIGGPVDTPLSLLLEQINLALHLVPKDTEKSFNYQGVNITVRNEEKLLATFDPVARPLVAGIGHWPTNYASDVRQQLLYGGNVRYLGVPGLWKVEFASIR